MKPRVKKLFSLLLAAVMFFSLVPSSARAEDGDDVDPNEVAGIAVVEDILIKPYTRDGHIRFGEASDLQTLHFRDSDGKETVSAVMSVADAIVEACKRTLGSGCTFDYLSYINLAGSQGTLYDGYNTEADTGMGVAGIEKYYYNEAIASSYRIQNIRFVPKTTFSGEAIVNYYGYYHYTEVDAETGKSTERRGSYSGRIIISVGKQEPGIAYSTDGEPVQFSSEDFTTYSLATNGRSFSYLSFRLPQKAEGALYYNYKDESIFDFAVASASRYYKNSSPSVDLVFFVPAKDYAGKVYIEFTGVDSANKPVNGELVITVTNNGPGHNQPRAEGPFAYEVRSGRPVSLDPQNFKEETARQLNDDFFCFSFASLPSASAGMLYDDSTAGIDHTVRAGVNYADPASIRFVARSGYTGVVSVPIVVVGKNGRTYDSMLRFAVLPGEDSPLRYKVEPERRVSFIGSDFSDASYTATGYDIARVHFDTLPPVSAGTLYYNNTPVTTHPADDYYKEQLGQISFLAAAGFTGETTVSFTGYAYGYSRSNNRAFHGTVTLVSTETVQPPAQIGGGASTLITMTTTGTAVALEPYRIESIASSVLPGTPATVSFTRPSDAAGRLCLDFSSISRCEPMHAGLWYSIADVARVSFLPKAGFSGAEEIRYTVRDTGGNSFTGVIRFIVTPPVRSSYFSDMGQYIWAVPAVDFFRYYGATSGVSTSSFGPDSVMKRADFILLLDRLFSFPYAGAASFDDVLEYKYYAEALAGAKAAGVISGTRIPAPEPEPPAEAEAGKPQQPGEPKTLLVFRPEDAITRMDAAVCLYRALLQRGSIQPATVEDVAALARFPDAVIIPAYALEAMAALVRDGVFQGYVHNLLPSKTLNRAEAITILYRALV